jgi:hypothetical protein
MISKRLRDALLRATIEQERFIRTFRTAGQVNADVCARAHDAECALDELEGAIDAEPIDTSCLGERNRRAAS